MTREDAVRLATAEYEQFSRSGSFSPELMQELRGKSVPYVAAALARSIEQLADQIMAEAKQ